MRVKAHEGEVGRERDTGVGDLIHCGQLPAGFHCLYLFLCRHLHSSHTHTFT